MSALWDCLACGMREIAHTFERCPSCWKDRHMPKISTSGVSDINAEVVAVDDATRENAPEALVVTATEPVDVPSTPEPESTPEPVDEASVAIEDASDAVADSAPADEPEPEPAVDDVPINEFANTPEVAPEVVSLTDSGASD